jgi:hypothetical protein
MSLPDTLTLTKAKTGAYNRIGVFGIREGKSPKGVIDESF